MTGAEVYEILVNRGIAQLYHANSVRTSISMLKLQGIASRQLVAQKQLPQSIQFSDDADKRVGVWNDIFFDTVDIHSRASNRNKYGPVAFVMDIAFLKSLPADSQVLVTRLNPSKWEEAPNVQRYFSNTKELSAGLEVGNFDQMITIRTRGGLVPFGNFLRSLILDEPRLTAGIGPEFQSASTALASAANTNNFPLSIQRRTCFSCKCLKSYAEKESRIPFFYSKT